MLKVHIKSFKFTEEPVLDNIKFSLEKGEHISILGESGCGKSTLLKLIYGTLQLTYGSLSWDNEAMLGPAYNLVPGEPFIKMVSQDFDLMPFTTVSDNIGKYLSRLDMHTRKARIKSLLDVVEMTTYKNRLVKTLSGGQQQRVAIARALAKSPKLLLLDEPFSHIDNFRKNKLRRTLYKFLKAENISCITATHDSEEALSFSDDIKVMCQGRIINSGTPESLYNNPKTKYVASFFEDVFVYNESVFYPQDIILSKDGKLQGVVKQSFFKGQFWKIEASVDNTAIYFNHEEELAEGLPVALKLKISNKPL